MKLIKQIVIIGLLVSTTVLANNEIEPPFGLSAQYAVEAQVGQTQQINGDLAELLMAAMPPQKYNSAMPATAHQKHFRSLLILNPNKTAAVEIECSDAKWERQYNWEPFPSRAGHLVMVNAAPICVLQFKENIEIGELVQAIPFSQAIQKAKEANAIVAPLKDSQENSEIDCPPHSRICK